MRVKLPPFAPDQSVNSGVLLTAKNVYPAVDGYRPVQDISTVSDALAEGFRGGYSAIAADGTAYLLAGTSGHLYRYEAGGTWATLLSGLSVTGRWRFAQFGNYVIAVTGGTTYEIDLGAGTASALVGAPSGTSIAVIGDYLMIGQAGGEVNKVQWSAFRDHTGWTDGVDQAGSLPMQTGGVVMGIAGGEYGIVLQRERLVRATRTGDSSAPFTFDEISNNFGCAASAVITQAGRTIFFRSDRGFMALDDGQALRPIGSEKVDRTFDRLVSRDDLESIYTSIDPQNKLVFWGIPGTPGTLWMHNFELDRWATAELQFSGIFPGFTTSMGIDDVSALYAPDGIDDIGLTVDDPRWSGGNPRLYLIDEAEKLGTLAGDTLPAKLDMGFMELTQGRRARVRGVRLISDVTGGVTIQMDARARLGDATNVKTATALRASGLIPIRHAGRFMSTSIQIAAAQDWDYIQGFDVEEAPGGDR